MNYRSIVLGGNSNIVSAGTNNKINEGSVQV